MKSLQAYAAKFNALKVRERMLISITVLVLFAVAWDYLVIDRLRQNQQGVITQTTDQYVQMASIQAKLAELQIRVKQQDPIKRREQLASLNNQIDAIALQLKERTVKVISPVQMVALLQDVFEQNPKLKLVSMENLQAKAAFSLQKNPLIADKNDIAKKQQNDSPTPLVYKHGIELEFTGSYQQVLSYLKRLEGLDWQFIWDAFSIEMQEFPTARARIRVYTLSLHEDWIGA